MRAGLLDTEVKLRIPTDWKLHVLERPVPPGSRGHLDEGEEGLRLPGMQPLTGVAPGKRLQRGLRETQREKEFPVALEQREILAPADTCGPAKRARRAHSMRKVPGPVHP